MQPMEINPAHLEFSRIQSLPGKGEEIQLTDAAKTLISKGRYI